MKVIRLAAREVYPEAPEPPSFSECTDICAKCPPWLFPQTQKQCVEHGCHRYREIESSKLPPFERRNLLTLPGDVRYGVCHQTGFKLRRDPAPPLFVQWSGGKASRHNDRKFDHLEVLGPEDHQRFLVDSSDWDKCLNTYRYFSDPRTDKHPEMPIRVTRPWVLEHQGAEWTQKKIDDWEKYYGKWGSLHIATPTHRPAYALTDEQRATQASLMPLRGARQRDPVPPRPPRAEPPQKGKGRGKGPAGGRQPPASSSAAAPGTAARYDEWRDKAWY
jgi:hypothetical protein